MYRCVWKFGLLFHQRRLHQIDTTYLKYWQTLNLEKIRGQMVLCHICHTLNLSKVLICPPKLVGWGGHICPPETSVPDTTYLKYWQTLNLEKIREQMVLCHILSYIKLVKSPNLSSKEVGVEIYLSRDVCTRYYVRIWNIDKHSIWRTFEDK